jgi:hypothetical protein
MRAPGASTAADWDWDWDWDCSSEEKTMPSVLPWAVRVWTVIFLPRTCRAEDERRLVSGDLDSNSDSDSDSDPPRVSRAVEEGSRSTRAEDAHAEDARAEDDIDVIPVVVPVGAIELSPKSGGAGDILMSEEYDGIAIKRGGGQLMG